MGEEIAGVTVLGALGLDCEASEERGSTAGGGDVGRSALLDGCGSSEGRDGRDDEDGLHCVLVEAADILDEVYIRLGRGREATRHSLLKLRLLTIFILRNTTVLPS